jgi:hypothetical protein
VLVFTPTKYKLFHFINRQTRVQPKLTPLPLDDGTLVPASQEAERYLGFWLDPELSFALHRAKAVIKAGTSLAALRGLAGSTWGVSIMVMRRIYKTVVIPQMLYRAAARYQASMPAKERNQIVQQFASVQKRAAVLISVIFRTTAAEALNIELHLTPMKHQIERMVPDLDTRRFRQSDGA